MNVQSLVLGVVGGLVFVSGPAFGSTDVELLRSYSLSQAAAAYETINAAPSDLKVAMQIQTRYQLNVRDDMGTTLASVDDDLTMGFVVRRAKVAITGKVAENMKAKLQLGFNRKTGAGALEDAVLTWAVNDDLRIRVGQFKTGVLREEMVSSKRQLAAERSAANETFNQDYTQGIEFGFGGDQWRAVVSFNEGFAPRNSAFNSVSESDFAASGRVEFLIGDAGFGQFKQFTSFRGADAGGMVGVAFHHEIKGDTNPAFTPTTDMTTVTGDFSWVGDGWNAFVSGVWRSMDTGAVTLDDYGVVVQGGVFVSDADEVFARWSSVMPDSDNGPGSDADYADVTVGWNHYMIPESHAAKFTLAVTYSLDAPDASIVKVSEGHNLLSDSEDGQIGAIAQFQILF